LTIGAPVAPNAATATISCVFNAEGMDISDARKGFGYGRALISSTPAS
jgi:hypothetical protein